jgi:large repetitive protein
MSIQPYGSLRHVTRARPRRRWRACLALAALLCSAQAFAAVDLVLNHTDTGYDPIPAGGIVQYTLRVDNNGSTGATGVVLTDNLPSGTSFVGSSSTQGSCAAPAGNVLTCNLGSVASLGTVTVTVQVRAPSPGLISETASVSASEADTDTSNNLDIIQQTTITQGADLGLALSASLPSVQAGSSLSYNFSVTNQGPDTASNVRVSGTLPAGFNPSGSLPAGCSVAGGVLTCDLSGTVASGASRTVGPISGVISAGGGSTVTFAASVSVTSGSAAQDPDSTNNTSTVSTAVTTGSDVRLTKQASVASPVLTATSFTYTLKTLYTGDAPQDLVVTDAVPANFQILSPASFTSNGWACTVSGQNLQCARAAGGATAGNNVNVGDIVLQAKAVTPGNGVINLATVNSSTPDPDASNNTGQATLTVVAPTADLYASKTGPNPALASAGSHWTWTIGMGNVGPAILVGNAVMSDTLPVGITLNSYSALNGWSCSPAAPFTASAGSQTVTCTRTYSGAGLAVGAKTPTVSYDVSAASDGSYNNTVCASATASGSDTPAADGNSSNDCASSGVGVQPSTESANLQFHKSVSPATVPAGDVLTYTMEIVNAGPATAANVVLSDTLDTLINNGVGPTGKGFIDATIVAGSATGGSCSTTAPVANVRALSCSFTSVPVCTAGSNCPVVTVHVRPGGDGGTRVNNADAVSNTTADPDYSDNGDSASNQVDARADVSVSKTATPSPAIAGQTLTYVITARNAGPSRAQTVGVTDALPLDVTFVSAAPSGGGSCTTTPVVGATINAGNRTLACGWGSIANAAQQTVTVKVRPNTITRGTTLTNGVTVDTTTTETDTTNNSASVDTPVSVPALDLLANISDSPDPVAVGDLVTYTLTVTNNGPSFAENVRLIDALPASKLSFVSLSSPAGASCTTPAVGATGGNVDCQLGGLAANASLQVTVQMKGEAKGTDTSTLIVSSDETVAGFDSQMGNNSVTEQTTVRPKADMEVVSKTAVPGTVGLRETFDYQISITNHGPGVGDNVQVADSLPAGMVLTGTPSVAPGSPADFPSLPGAACTGNAGAGSFVCSFGDDVASGATALITVPVIVTTAPAGASPGTLSNTATISTNSKDEVPSNNSKTGSVQVRTATLAGHVYNDADASGGRDGGEAGIAGATVKITGTAPDGTPVTFTTTSAADGSYSFSKLPAGTYTVTETQPSGWLDGGDSPGNAGGTAAASPGDQISGITLSSSSAATGYDFGEYTQGTLAGVVYRDLNNDGVHAGAGETGIAGVGLTLTGTDDLSQAVSLTTTSAADGSYGFGPLRPGTYTVTETPPAGFLPGKATPGTGTAAAGSAAGDGNSIAGVTLTAGQGGASFNFGELPPTGLAGFVYVDSNRNGARDGGETAGIAGVTVTLTGTDDQGTPVNLTATTDASGAYHFDNLRPGTYSVIETQPAAWDDGGDSVGSLGGTLGNDTVSAITLAAGQSGTGYNFGEVGQGLAGFVYVDSNGNGTRDAGEPGIAGVTVAAAPLGGGTPVNATTDASGAYLFADLPAGSWRIDETQPVDYVDGGDSVGSLGGSLAGSDTITSIPLGVAQVGTNYNFGEGAGRLAGSVYIDSNGNGMRDAGEPGIAGVTVTLVGTDVHGAAVSRPVTTDASGAYLINDLLPSNGAGYTLTETQPGAYADGAEHPGNLGGSAGASGTSTIGGIVVGAGGQGSAYDFGELTGGIAGSAYVDADNDGVRDTAEKGIVGVTVHLTGTDVDGHPVDRTLVTGADGNYVFDGLTRAGPGGYTVTETQPSGYLDGKAVPGMVDGSPCSACDIATVNRTGTIAFDPAQTFSGFDFPELSPGSLAGSVYDDVDGNGVLGKDEALAGVTLTLTGTDDQGKAISLTATTAADGSYYFDNLRPGTYVVTETQPAGLADIGSHAGNLGGSTSTNAISAIVLASGAAGTGYDFLEQGGLLAGAVFFDKNANGQRDAGEPGLPGVTITLSGDAGRTAVTDADGRYRFVGLVGGNYAVTEMQPPLYKDGGVHVGSVGGTAGTNAIVAIALPAGSNASSYDFPELTGADGSIAGTAWLNQPGGNPESKDPGETGLTGWQVELYQNGNRVPGVDAVTTDAAGHYLITGVPAASGYEIRFLSPNGVHYGYPVSQGPDAQWNGTVDHAASIPAITGVTVGSGVKVLGQDLPVDPSGVVYDSVTRKPLAGARVTLLDPSGQPVPPQYLAGGAGNVTQTTDTDGYYQFLLLPGAPAGAYSLRIESPTGYLPAPSGIHAPAANALTVPAGTTPYHVSPLAGPPADGELPPYYLSFVITGMSAGVTGNHVPLDPVLQGALRVRKTTSKVNVTKADLVPYTIEISNTLAVPLGSIAARDLVPAGFKYRSGSARVDGVAREPEIRGRELSWPDLSFGPNQTRTVQLVLIVGTGVGEGEYTNQAWALNTIADRVVSNVGTATVRIVPDPTFDCADLIGKVFEDRNANGYQDQGEPGLPAVRLVTPRGLLVTTDADGRYHIPCAAVPEHDRGANFVIKLDERTLPTGYRLTTENPGDVRVTAGKMAKINFGATIHRVLRVDMSAAAFDGGHLLPAFEAQLSKLYATLQGKPSLVRIAYHLTGNESRDRAQPRIDALRRRITDDWNSQGRQYPLQVEQEIIEVQP